MLHKTKKHPDLQKSGCFFVYAFEIAYDTCNTIIGRPFFPVKYIQKLSFCFSFTFPQKRLFTCCYVLISLILPLRPSIRG